MPLTIATMHTAIGATALWNPKGTALQIPVRITRVRNAYGNVRLDITPRDGSGTHWVEEGRLML